MVLRPDEIASEKEIERDKRFRSNIGSGIAAAAPIALGATGGFSKIMPFLNELVPIDLALKGINKLSPKIGKMLRHGQEMGLDIREGLDFVKENIEKSEQSKKPAKSLFMQMLGGNEPPKSLPQHLQFQIDAIQNIANKYEKEGKTIESPEVRKLTQRLKNILQGKGMLSGANTQPQQGNQMMQQAQGMGQPMQPNQMASMQGQPQNMGQQQGAGQGQQALMAILQKIQAQRGA